MGPEWEEPEARRERIRQHWQQYLEQNVPSPQHQSAGSQDSGGHSSHSSGHSRRSRRSDRSGHGSGHGGLGGQNGQGPQPHSSASTGR